MTITAVNAMLPPDERGGLGEGTRVSIVESFWLATTGGAEALGLPTGTFEPGRAFDMQVVDTKRPDCDLTGFGVFDAPIDRLARILYLSTPDNVRKVYAQVFDKREVDAMIAFYSSPEGASILKKSPQVLAATMQEVQPIARDTMTEVKAMIDEEIAADKPKQ